MIRRLAASVALVGAIAVAAAALPLAQVVIDGPADRAAAAELRDLAARARLAAGSLRAGAALRGLCDAGEVTLVVISREGQEQDRCAPLGLTAAPQVRAELLTSPRARISAGWALVRVEIEPGRTLGAARPATATLAAERAGTRAAAILGAVALALVALLAATASTWAKAALATVVAGVRDVVRGNARRVTSDAEPGETAAELHTWLNALAEEAERKDALLAEQQKLLAILEGMTQGVVALDDGKVELMNQAARKMLALPAPLVGEPLAEHVDAPELAALVRGGKAGVIEVMLPAKIRALARQSGRPGRGMVLVLEDVSAIRHLETVRRDFVANVSHELRTPVAVIRANAETLLAGAKDDPAMAGKLVEGLHRNAERLARLIADLLDLSRLDAGHYRLELGRVELGTAVEHALTAIGDRRPPPSVHVAPGLAARADRKALDQVLVNLLENAVRYTPGGTEIELVATREGARARLEVRDRGPGIPQAHRDRVFERFYRADPGRNREAGGTGLGLAIVKHLVESMEGEVELQPNSPSGCVFIVRLPLA